MKSTPFPAPSAPFSSSEAALAYAAGSPPSCNTGARNTRVDASLDWLAFTGAAEHLAEVQAFVGGPDAEWTQLERGAHGYPQAMASGTTRILYGVRGELHVICTGTTLGLLRERGVSDRQTLEFAVTFARNVTRLDVAFDSLGSTLSLDVVRDHLERNAVVSRFKGWGEVSSMKLGQSDVKGRTITMGSRKSNSYLRFYDKGLETGTMPAGAWIRCELELKDEKAMAAVHLFLAQDIDGAAGLLAGLVDFKDDSTGDTNRSRHPRAGWWDRFLSSARKISLGLPVARRSLVEAVAWIKKQVAPTLSAAVEALGGDLAVIHELLADGRTRQRAKHRLLAASSLCPA